MAIAKRFVLHANVIKRFNFSLVTVHHKTLWTPHDKKTCIAEAIRQKCFEKQSIRNKFSRKTITSEFSFSEVVEYWHASLTTRMIQSLLNCHVNS